MKFVIAPDSYKGCLRSVEVCRYLSEGIKQFCPQSEVEITPMADGGEGSVDAVVLSTQGEFRKYEVYGPLGETVEALYGIAGKKMNRELKLLLWKWHQPAVSN